MNERMGGPRAAPIFFRFLLGRTVSGRVSPLKGRFMAISAVMPVFARTDIVFERGEGAWLTATDGRRFLDFAAGVAVNSLGHAHPHLVARLKEQADKLWHCSNLYRVAGQEKVAARLV